MQRTPPTNVRRRLRQEVYFGCPVPDCGSPYLTWHHFDPPWRRRQHHNPTGMIALCREHHDKAEAGTYTIEQLRHFKVIPWCATTPANGRFDWLRRELVAVLGDNLFIDTPTLIAMRKTTVIGFTRDSHNHMLLDVNMPSATGRQRLSVKESGFVADGNPVDFEAPPHGRLIAARYANGDRIRIEFFDISSKEDAVKLYPSGPFAHANLTYPAVAVDFELILPGLGIHIDSRGTQVSGVSAKGCIFRECGAIALE